MKNVIMATLFGVHHNTIGNWKKEERGAFALVDKYITDEEALFFMENGYIPRLDNAAELEGAYIDPIDFVHIMFRLSGLTQHTDKNSEDSTTKASSLLFCVAEYGSALKMLDSRFDPIEWFLTNISLSRFLEFHLCALLAKRVGYSKGVYSHILGESTSYLESITQGTSSWLKDGKFDRSAFDDVVNALAKREEIQKYKTLRELYISMRWILAEPGFKKIEYTKDVLQNHLYAEQHFAQLEKNLPAIKELYGLKRVSMDKSIFKTSVPIIQAREDECLTDHIITVSNKESLRTVRDNCQHLFRFNANNVVHIFGEDNPIAKKMRNHMPREQVSITICNAMMRYHGLPLRSVLNLIKDAAVEIAPFMYQEDSSADYIKLDTSITIAGIHNFFNDIR